MKICIRSFVHLFDFVSNRLFNSINFNFIFNINLPSIYRFRLSIFISVYFFFFYLPIWKFETAFLPFVADESYTFEMNCATHIENYMIIMHWYETWEVPYCHNIRHWEKLKVFCVASLIWIIISPIIFIIIFISSLIIIWCGSFWCCAESFYWNNYLSSNTLSQRQKPKLKRKITACIAVEIFFLNFIWTKIYCFD